MKKRRLPEHPSFRANGSSTESNLGSRQSKYCPRFIVSLSLMPLLRQIQCRIFSHNFNPQGLRLGNKILRQRLRGPALAAYYPRKTVSFRDLQNIIEPFGLTTFDEAEDDREEAIQM